MKYVTAIIQPGRLDPVMEALNELGISGMTVSEVRGYGRQKGKSEVYRGAEYTIQFLPKIKLEIAVSNKEAAAVTEAIKTAGETGKIGDGKIFVIDLPEAIRIRTGKPVIRPCDLSDLFLRNFVQGASKMNNLPQDVSSRSRVCAARPGCRTGGPGR